MISFFKKIFQPKEENVQFSELGQWLDKKNEELELVKEKLQEIEGMKFEITENLKILNEVDVSQAKVEDRIKNIVQGNLPAYANALNLFLRRVNPPKEIDYISLEIFCEHFEKEFEDLNKRTFRNFQIIRELVGKELENVAKSVKNLEVLVKDIKKHSVKIKKLAELKKEVEDIKDSFDNKEKNIEKKKELSKKKEELILSCEKLKKEIENLKKSDKAKSLEISKSEEKKVLDSIKELENQFITFFSPLQKAFKKYNNICFIKKVDSYIEDPVNTLFKDTNLEILSFLKDVKKMIEEGKIDLREEKKKKAMEGLDKLDESLINKFLEKHKGLSKKLSSIQEEIHANTVPDDIENLEKEFNICNFKIENVEREMGKIKDVDIESDIHKLENKISKALDIKVKIENAMG